MADRRKLNQLLAKALSGKEIARLALQNYMDEQAGKQPTFSEADLERARATLRGRPDEAAVYNAWIEAARIIDYTSLEAIGKALEAEKRLVWVISSILGLLRHGLLRHARQRATRILTPAEWATFPARREQARRARMAEEKVSFAEVTHGRAWWLAPEELKARARSLPDFDDDSGRRLRLPAAPRCGGRGAAPPDGHGGDRGAGQGSQAAVRPQRQERLGQAQGWQAHERGWRGHRPGGRGRVHPARAGRGRAAGMGGAGQAEHLTPSEFRGPVAVLQEVPPEYLDEQGRFVDPGWQQIEDQLRREIRPDKLQALQEEIASCQLFIRVFLARKAIIEVFSQELGLDLIIPPVRDREQAIRDLLAIYNQQAARSWEGEPDEEGFVPPDEMLAFPRDLRLPLIDVAKLEPDPAEVELMRQSLARPLVDDWWEAADELGVCGALGDLDLDRKEQLRQRGRKLGWSRVAIQDL